MPSMRAPTWLSVACPRLVPLIEGDDPFAEETAAAVREYAYPAEGRRGRHGHPRLHALPADPAEILQRVFGREVTLVFSAEETAREVAETLARKQIENDAAREGTYRFLTTGDVDGFRTMGRRFLQLPIEHVEHVEIATSRRQPHSGGPTATGTTSSARWS